MTIKVVFTSHDNLGSSLIRAIDGGVYSHMALVLPGDRVVESVKKTGVRIRRLDSLLSDAWRYSLFTLEVPDEESTVKFATAQVGKPYDVTGLIGFGFARDWQKDDQWYCSELGMTALSAGGIKLAGAYSRVGVRLAHEVCNAYATARIVV